MSNLLVIYTYNMYNVYEIFYMALHNLLWKLTAHFFTHQPPFFIVSVFVDLCRYAKTGTVKGNKYK